jgi:hypothetical protein
MLGEAEDFTDFAAPRRRLRRPGTLDTHDRTPSRLRHRTRNRRQDRTGWCGDRPGRVGAGRPGRRGPRRAGRSSAGDADPRRDARPGTARGRGFGQQSSSSPGTAAPGRDADGAGDPEPGIRVGEYLGAVGFPQGCLASGSGPVRIHRYGAWRHARKFSAAAGRRSRAAVAPWIHLAERPGVQRPAGGAHPRRGGTAARVLPVDRAAATRVLRSACAARSGLATRVDPAASAIGPRLELADKPSAVHGVCT